MARVKREQLLLNAAVLLGCCIAFSYAQCPSNEYYGVLEKASCPWLTPKGSILWKCKGCPENAIQVSHFTDYYLKKPQLLIDEVCVCRSGYRAEDASFTCAATQYQGNPDGIVPPIPEEFKCADCPYSHYCLGGAVTRSTCSGDGTNCVTELIGHQPPVPFTCYNHMVPMKYATPDDKCRCPLGTSMMVFPGDLSGTLNCGCPAGHYLNGDVKYYEDFWPNFFSQQSVCTPCERDHYCEGGRNPMKTCPPGRRTNGVNAKSLSDCSICSPACAQGTQYCTPVDMVGEICQECPAMGTYCPSKDVAGMPVPCPTGTYRNSKEQTECVKCETGKYSSRQGSTYCEPCPPGQYQDEEGKVGCKLCPPGSHQHLQSKSGCELCKAGTYQPFSGSSEAGCLSCPVGYATTPNLALGSKSLLEACELCKPGYFAAPKQRADLNYVTRECTPCSPGTFNPYVGWYTCSSCPEYMTSPSAATSIEQCYCDEKNAYLDPASGNCVPCAACGKGTYIVQNVAEIKCTADTSGSSSRCVACKPTCGRNRYMIRTSLCTGKEQVDLQGNIESSCGTCTQSCLEGDVMVRHCYSGNGSVDTVMCVKGAASYTSMYESACPLGSYLSPYVLPVTSMLSSFQLLPGPGNKLFAIVEPLRAVSIWVAAEAREGGAGWEILKKNAYPLMEYVPQGSTGDVHIIASCTWSLDGNSLYVVRMDATIDKMTVYPGNLRGTMRQWSTLPTYANQVFANLSKW